MALKNPKITAEKFLKNVDESALSPINDLKKLTLDELAFRAESIVKQSTEMLAFILLEGRRRQNKPDYANWVKGMPCLNAYSPQYRSALLRYAKFAETHKMIGISMTAGIRIASVKDKAIAEEVYEYSLRKNLSIDEVERLIEQKQAVLSIEHDEEEAPEEPSEPREKQVIEVVDNKIPSETNVHTDVNAEEEPDYVSAVLAYIRQFNVSPLIQLRILDGCTKKISGELYRK
jgi:hypothetical protein